MSGTIEPLQSAKRVCSTLWSLLSHVDLPIIAADIKLVTRIVRLLAVDWVHGLAGSVHEIIHTDVCCYHNTSQPGHASLPFTLPPFLFTVTRSYAPLHTDLSSLLAQYLRDEHADTVASGHEQTAFDRLLGYVVLPCQTLNGANVALAFEIWNLMQVRCWRYLSM